MILDVPQPQQAISIRQISGTTVNKRVEKYTGRFNTKHR